MMAILEDPHELLAVTADVAPAPVGEEVTTG
jgi:hypothetical protein